MLIKEVKNALKHFHGMRNTVALANDWGMPVDLRARFFIETVTTLLLCEGDKYKQFEAHYIRKKSYEHIAVDMYADKCTVQRNCARVVAEIAVALEVSGLQYHGWLCDEE